MSGFDAKNKWVCPNDRELTLRARLDAGWSVKSSSINTSGKSEQINESEQEAILKVIRKAQRVEQAEKDRINRMVEKLKNMKRNAKGDGKSNCVLCNEEFGIFGAQSHVCKDCNKSVCNKCGIDTFNPENEPLWLCKICSETREIWKKSGAWFANSLPAEININETQRTIAPIKSPISGRGSVSDNSLPSPVMLRKDRSQSPMRNRNRSPDIADYGLIFDHRKQSDNYLGEGEFGSVHSLNTSAEMNLSRSNTSLNYMGNN